MPPSIAGRSAGCGRDHPADHPSAQWREACGTRAKSVLSGGVGGEWVCEEGEEGLQGPFIAKDMPDALGPY